jgi:hypothetical protein
MQTRFVIFSRYWFLVKNRVSAHSTLGGLQRSHSPSSAWDLRPHTSDLRPQISDLRSQTSDLRTQNSELRPQTSELRTQNSELRTQNSELRPQTLFLPFSLRLHRGTHPAFPEENDRNHYKPQSTHPVSAHGYISREVRTSFTYIKGKAISVTGRGSS